MGASVAAAWLIPGLRTLPFSVRLAAGALLASCAGFVLALSPVTLRLWPALAVAAGIAGMFFVRRPPKLALPLLVVVPYAVMLTVNALAPEIGPDAITYHTAIPAEWLRTGNFFAPVGHYETMPHGIEILFAASGARPKLAHFCFFVATLPLMLAVARKLGFDGWPAACLYLLIPAAGVCATSAYVDAALAYFALAAFYFVLDDRPGWGGALAGFCYAVKMTGIVAGPAVTLYFAARKRWRDAALSAATCGAVMAPWMLRAWWMSGNPVAPLLNDWFPNPFFHPATEEALKQYVGSYGVAWRDMALELTLGGARLNGLLGPALLAAPLGLLALRRSAGQALWVAAAVASIPWWFNHGTRFLLPAAMFLCLAMAAALPRQLAWLLALVQGIACWPAVMDRWVDPAAWRIKDIPVAAAFGIEREEDYLKRVSPEYRIASFVKAHTKEGDRILDLVGIATGCAGRPVFNHWQYADAERAADALRVSAFADAGTFRQLQALWSPRKLSAIRVELLGPSRQSWALQEIELLRNGAAIFPSRKWELDADPNPWETPLLFDRNPASRWQSWANAEPGMYVEVWFPEPLDCDGIRILGWRDDSAPVRISGREVVGGWVTLSRSPDRRATPPLSLRGWAHRYLRHEGFVGLIVQGSEGIGGDRPWSRLGRILLDHPGDWGLHPLGFEDGVALLSLLGSGG